MEVKVNEILIPSIFAVGVVSLYDLIEKREKEQKRLGDLL